MRKEKLSILKEVESLMNENVKKARKLAMSHNLRLPQELRRQFCHKCNSLYNVKNSQVRLSKGKITVKCLKCNSIARIPYKPKKS